MLVLSRSDIAGVLNIAQVVDAVEAIHLELTRGLAVDFGPASLNVPGSSARLLPMMAATASSGGVKLLADSPDNVKSHLPRQQSTILLLDTATGACEAFLDGALITQFRTAAASAVATKYLSRTDAETLGFVGAGALARSHLHALCLVRPFQRVRIWSRSRQTAAAFATYASSTLDVDVQVTASPQEVVEHCDVLSTLTPSIEPIVRGSWFRPGLHVNAVGSPPRSDYREIDTEGIRRSRVVVDSFQVAREKAGDLLIPLSEGAITEDHFRLELGDVIGGGLDLEKRHDEITLYKSVGIGAQDIATARLVVQAARAKGIGTEITLTD